MKGGTHHVRERERERVSTLLWYIQEETLKKKQVRNKKNILFNFVQHGRIWCFFGKPPAFIFHQIFLNIWGVFYVLEYGEMIDGSYTLFKQHNKNKWCWCWLICLAILIFPFFLPGVWPAIFLSINWNLIHLQSLFILIRTVSMLFF